jgi:hypothetical protein
VLALFVASVALSLTGSGAFSVDRLLEARARKEESIERLEPDYPRTVEVR